MNREYNGRDGRDGRDGHDGKDGIRGAPGSQGRRGYDGPIGPKGCDGNDGQIGPTGKNGLQGESGLNTSTFSFVNPSGVSGTSYTDGMDILYIVNRVRIPITYFCIIWSITDTTTLFAINIKDVSNKVIQSLTIGPSPVPNGKNVYEIFFSPFVTTTHTRLLKFSITVAPTSQQVTIYSIMVG